LGVPRQLAGRALRYNLFFEKTQKSIFTSLPNANRIAAENYCYLMVPCLFKKYTKNQLFF